MIHADQSADVIVRQFVLEKAAGEPLARRALIYRALAAIEQDGEQARCLQNAADVLDEADRRAGQLLLDLRIREARK